MMEVPILSNERRNLILNYIEECGRVSIADLAKLCPDCSNMTIWRDLNRLEQEGLIKRTHGGAVAARFLQIGLEGQYVVRALENTEAKQKIAQLAISFVQPNTSIFLDAGSTIMSLAKILPNQYYSIITSGINIAAELAKRSNCIVTIVGGQVAGNTLSCSGASATAFIDSVNIDTAIMASTGFSITNGFTNGSFTEHQLKRQVIQKAKADHHAHGPFKGRQKPPLYLCNHERD